MFNQYKDFDAKNIFKTFNSHPAYDGRLNGLDAFIMQSDENKQKILESAKELVYVKNIDKITAVNAVLNRYDLSLISDFTDIDRKEIMDWVEDSDLIF